MSSNHPTAANPQAEYKSPQRDECDSENHLENRIQNLDRLLHSVHGALRQVSFSGKIRALNLMNDLLARIKATHNMLRVARLLSEPARESMLSRVYDSTKELEETIAAHLDIEMT
jgi:hypothetical protein